MKTINEIRDMIKEHQEYGYTDISLDVAVTLLAEIDRLNELVTEYAESNLKYENKFRLAMSALHPFTLEEINPIFYEQAKTIYEELSK